MNRFFAFILALTVVAPSFAQSAFTGENPRDLVGKTCYAALITPGKAQASKGAQKWVITEGKDGNDLSIQLSNAFGQEAFDDPKKASMKDLGLASSVKVSGNNLLFTSPAGSRYVLFLVGGSISGKTNPIRAEFLPADVNARCE